MTQDDLRTLFAKLSTPLLADASVRLGVPVHAGPPELAPLVAGTRLAGRALPVRHYGSVDVFLEVLDSAESGDILVVDNGGRKDEACVGDLTALEARAYGVAGMVVWGCHRDTAELVDLGFPVFSLGAVSFGPRRLEPREPDALVSARLGRVEVTRDHAILADRDGVLVAPLSSLDRLARCAGSIFETERRQAEAVKRGKTLHHQLRFAEYLAERESNPDYTLREHLVEVGGAVEV